MKKFFIITFLISSFTYALNCNTDYLVSSKDSIVLSSEDTIIKNSLNKIIKQKELLLNDGEFVIVQNISLGSDSINLEPKINSSEYTVNHLNNLKKMETMVEKGEIILPDYIKKDDFFIFNKSLQNSIEIFLADSSNSKNLNLFNSFLYFNSIKFEHKYKFIKNCDMESYELGAIAVYTGGLYKYINKSLRNDVSLNSLKNLVNIFNSGLVKLAPYEAIVIRGSNLTEPYLSQHAIGNTVLYKGLTSTSNGVPFVADYKFTILSKEGRDISEISFYPDEKEILFKPMTQFKIDNKVGNEFFMTEVLN